MTTTSEKLQIIIDNKAAIKQAIIKKGGEVRNFTTYASAIANLPSGGGDINPTAEKNDVTFYDYDGTIRYSYTAEEFLTLTEMPPLPTQKGLICQEWNWSFDEAKEYVAEYGVLDVGATYITDDGKTRLYIRIAAEGRMDIPLYFQQTVANGVTIDWGDGSPTETLDSTGKVNITHRYTSIGDYMISLDVADGCTLKLGHSINGYCVMGSTDYNRRVYCNMLRKVEIGTGITVVNTYAFPKCCFLRSVIIPKSVTLNGSTVFSDCYSLRSIVIPNLGTSIGGYVFYNCSSLSSVSIPESVTSIGSYAFGNCYPLRSVVIPKSVTSIEKATFGSCFSLSSVSIPESVTSIGSYAFGNCYGMAFYDFSHHTAVPTLENADVFTGIPDDCKIIVPDNLYDTWITATNWSEYASYIIKKTDWDERKNNQ